eukprot:tig00020510_g9908.t1
MMDLIYNLATDRESTLSSMDEATATRLAVYMMYTDKHIIPRLQSRYPAPGGPAELKAVYEKNREKVAAPVHIAQYGTSSLEMMDLLYNLATDRESTLSSMDKETEKRLSSYIKYAEDFVVPRLRTFHPGGLAELKAVYERNREKIAAAVGKNEARRQELAARRAQKNSASTSAATGAEAAAPDPNEETAAENSSSGSDNEGGRGTDTGAGSGGADDVQGVGPAAGSAPSNLARPDGPLKKTKHLSHYGKSIIEKTDLIYNLATDPDLAVSLLSKPTSSAIESLYIMYVNQFVVPRLRTYHPGGLADLKALYERNREKIADAVEKNAARRQAQAAARSQARQSVLSMRTSVAAAAEGGARASNGEAGTSLPPQRGEAPAAAAGAGAAASPPDSARQPLGPAGPASSSGPSAAPAPGAAPAVSGAASTGASCGQQRSGSERTCTVPARAAAGEVLAERKGKSTYYIECYAVAEFFNGDQAAYRRSFTVSPRPRPP